MSLNDLLTSSYGWADQNAILILVASVLLPIAGTALAWIGRGGRTDSDGRFIASLVMGTAMLGVAVEILAVFVARAAMGARLMDANALLLAAPVLLLAGAILGVRTVFPLNELGSVKAAADLGAFAAASGFAVWMLSKFRGWGIVFVGSFTQLIVVAAIAIFFLWRLYRRAFGPDRRAPPEGALAAPPISGPKTTLASAALAAGVVAATAAALVGFAHLTRSRSFTVAGPGGSGGYVGSDERVRGGSGQNAAAEEKFFSYVDDSGSQVVVRRPEEAPEKFRSRVRPLP